MIHEVPYQRNWKGHSTTLCDRRQRGGPIWVGTRDCMACSYCYGVDPVRKVVKCLKSVPVVKLGSK